MIRKSLDDGGGEEFRHRHTFTFPACTPYLGADLGLMRPGTGVFMRERT